jgi:hypothetical protein
MVNDAEFVGLERPRSLDLDFTQDLFDVVRRFYIGSGEMVGRWDIDGQKWCCRVPFAKALL